MRNTPLRSAGTYGSVRFREMSVLWDVRLKRFHCMHNMYIISYFSFQKRNDKVKQCQLLDVFWLKVVCKFIFDMAILRKAVLTKS